MRLAVAALLMAVITPANADPNEDHRATCEQASDVVGVNDTIRSAVIEVCIGEDRRAKAAVIQKSYLVPSRISEACMRANSSYLDVNKCLDQALPNLPRGSGVIAMEESGGQVGMFWTFGDCANARLARPHGVCINW